MNAKLSAGDLPTQDSEITSRDILRRRADVALQTHLEAQNETISALREELSNLRGEYMQSIREMRTEIALQRESSQPIIAWVASRMDRQQKIERAAEKGVLTAIGVFVAGIAAFIVEVIRRRLG